MLYKFYNKKIFIILSNKIYIKKISIKNIKLIITVKLLQNNSLINKLCNYKCLLVLKPVYNK